MVQVPASWYDGEGHSVVTRRESTMQGPKMGRWGLLG